MSRPVCVSLVVRGIARIRCGGGYRVIRKASRRVRRAR